MTDRPTTQNLSSEKSTNDKGALKMKVFRKMLVGAVCMAAACIMSVTAYADDGIPIDEEHFPDKMMRQYVLSYFDKDMDTYLSDEEIEEATVISSNYYINSLTGVNYLPNLTIIDIDENARLQELDLSGNPKLEELYVNGTFPTVDLSCCPELKKLSIENSSMTDINISTLTKLEELTLNGASLKKLDLHNNTALKSIYLTALFEKENNHNDNYDVTESNTLDLSSQTQLEALTLFAGGVHNIDLHNCSALKYLTMEAVSLSSLDLSDCTELTILSSHNVFLNNADIDISPCTKLTEFYYTGNIEVFDMSNQPDLEVFNCSSWNLKDLDVSKCMHLREFNLSSSSQINSIDLTGNKELEHIYISDCTNTSEIKFDCKDTLKELAINYCLLSELDLTGYSSLKFLNCSFNYLEALNVRDCAELTELHCDDNLLTELDITKCSKLGVLSCSNNRLVSLDLRNCPILSKLQEKNKPTINQENNTVTYSDDNAFSSLTHDQNVIYATLNDESLDIPDTDEQPNKDNVKNPDGSNTIPKLAAVGVASAAGGAAVAAAAMKISKHVKRKKKDDEDTDTSDNGDSSPLL